jgi:hypothetical protein
MKKAGDQAPLFICEAPEIDCQQTPARPQNPTDLVDALTPRFLIRQMVEHRRA